jgi:hypothetical protein
VPGYESDLVSGMTNSILARLMVKFCSIGSIFDDQDSLNHPTLGLFIFTRKNARALQRFKNYLIYTHIPKKI